MIKMMQNTLVLLTIVAVVLAAADKLNQLPKSHLILEYNWPEPIKNLRRLPHSESCNHFYLTKPDGNHVLKKCFGDDIFDYRSLRCMEKTYAKCWRDIVKKGNIKKVKRQFLCPYHWGLYPDTEDCSQFYDCLSGKPYPRKCPADTLFDKVERTCLPISEAKCAGEQGNMKEVKRQFFCRNHRGLYPDTEDCSQFYDCFNGKPYSRKCPAGAMFDKIKRTCLPSKEARCAGEPDITKTDNILSETTPLTKTVRISGDSESSTNSGTDSGKSISKEENSSEDMKKNSEQAKSTTIFKIITSDFNELTADKKHIVTSDNLKFTAPHIDSDEDSSEEEDERYSTSSKVKSKTLTVKIAGGSVTRSEKATSSIKEMGQETSTQAKSTPIVTSDLNEMTTDKKHIIKDNSKFTAPHIDSDEKNPEEEDERYSTSPKIKSAASKTLTVRIAGGGVTRNEKATSAGITKMSQETSAVSNDGSERLQTAVSSVKNTLTPENTRDTLSTTSENYKIVKILKSTISPSEKSTYDKEPTRKNFNLLTQTPGAAELITDNVSCQDSLSHPFDKHKFIIICEDGSLKVKTCPANMVYDDISGVCVLVKV